MQTDPTNPTDSDLIAFGLAMRLSETVGKVYITNKNGEWLLLYPRTGGGYGKETLYLGRKKMPSLTDQARKILKEACND